MPCSPMPVRSASRMQADGSTAMTSRDREREGQRIAAGAGADVEPASARLRRARAGRRAPARRSAADRRRTATRPARRSPRSGTSRTRSAWSRLARTRSAQAASSAAAVAVRHRVTIRGDRGTPARRGAAEVRAACRRRGSRRRRGRGGRARGWAARTGPKPRSPASSSARRQIDATGEDRVRRAVVGVAGDDERASPGVRRPRRAAAWMTAGRTRGWSPGRMTAASTAPGVGVERPQPDPDRARQALLRASGSTTRRSPAPGRGRRARRPAGRRRRSGSRPAATRGVDDVARRSGGRRASARSLPPPNREPAPAASTTAADLHADADRPDRGPSRRAAGAVDERRAAAAVPLGDDLGDDRERRLGRVPAAEVEPDRARAGGRARRRVTPASRSRARRSPCVFFEPTAPTYRQPRRSASTIAGSSNFTSWVRTATASSGPEPDLVGDLVRPADDEAIDPVRREPLRGRERGPAVDDDDLVAELLRETASDRATSTAPTITSRGLTGNASTKTWRSPIVDGPGRARGGAPRRAAATSASSAAEPSEPSSGRRRGRRSARRRARRRPARGARTRPAARRREDRRDRDPPRSRAPRHGCRRDDGLDENIDRPATGQPDVPRLLVADPVADHPAVPVARTRSISSAAAPSTQPPLTEPAIRPSSARIRTAPSGRGALPNVRTTTARPRRRPRPSSRPASREVPASDRACSSAVSGRAAESVGSAGVRPAAAGACPDRRARLAAAGIGARPPPRRRAGCRSVRIPARISPSRSRLATVPPATKSSMYGMAARMPAGERLVAGRAGQRVEPDEPVAVPPEAGRLGRDEGRVAAVPAVGHDDHDAGRAERPARPVVVEVAEPLADARPAGPVVDAVGDPRQRPVPVAVAQEPGHPGQARPEHERLGPDLDRRGQRLDEPQQQPRVALHRARDVAHDDDLARPRDRRRQTHSVNWPPVGEVRRNIARGASRRPWWWSS